MQMFIQIFKYRILNFRYKKIMAFQEIDGIDVVFFAFIVQEYGAKCPPPNQGKVYLAYLDSIHFFTPSWLRTKVYQKLLLSYMAYIKLMGFSDLYIWACPPNSVGWSDYIFYSHPPEQKIPDAPRLRAWYEKLWEKGVEDGTIMNWRVIGNFFSRIHSFN